MGEKVQVKVLVEGGKATPAPPLGPTLAPLKVNVGKVVADINQKTKEMAGMQVPVTVTVDTATKEYTLAVGTPPVSALIKKELRLEKGSEATGIKRVGDLTVEQVKKIAKIKFGHESEGFVRQVTGTGRSMGVSVGKGAVTEEERRQAEEFLKAKAAAEAAPAAVAAEGAAPAEGAASETPAEKKEAKGKESKTKEAPKAEEKKPADKKAPEKKK